MTTGTPINDLLRQPIAWRQWRHDRTVHDLLEDLQANILKGHGRPHTRHSFWSFQGADRQGLQSVVHRLAHAMPSALKQLRDTEEFKATGRSGGPVLCFFLRPGGYAALGKAAAAPTAAAFTAGLQKRGPDPALKPPIADPALPAWQEEFRQPIDAKLLVAADTDPEADAVAAHWAQQLKAAGATLLVTEQGQAIKRKVNDHFEGVEHFGYVDGRSQPLFLAEDVAGEPRAFWDPAFPPAQFLTRDPGSSHDHAFGSFFVFRKLEQNVAGFKAKEDELSAALSLAGTPFEERAGALVVGRFEDGSPVVLDPLPTDLAPVNDFDYRSDMDGSRCPFRAHIRKTNPRGESPFQLAKSFGFGTTVRAERAHIMARRGITYGQRHYNEQTNDFDDSPSAGVGLLFMAYMADLAAQFEFTQATWANNPSFVTKEVGIDPVIGQGGGQTATVWADGWSGNKTAQPFDFAGFVTMKGGEYFFAPSLSFLRHV